MADYPEKAAPNGPPGPYPLDDGGFLLDIHCWDEGFVERYAPWEIEGAVTPKHLDLIRFARSHFLRHRKAPMPHDYARHGRLTIRAIHDLFPGGLISLTRLAGLPQPKNC
jgi:sulfur relay (sulfurtransferase) DsrC/TusE family protein